MFVEGTRQRFGYPGPIHSGALTIALKERVPVIPAGLESFGWGPRKTRRPCAVVWGGPMHLDDIPANGKGYREAAELVRLEILRLWRQAAEAVAAGFPPELPDGSRRSSGPARGSFTASTHPAGSAGSFRGRADGSAGRDPRGGRRSRPFTRGRADGSAGRDPRGGRRSRPFTRGRADGSAGRDPRGGRRSRPFTRGRADGSAGRDPRGGRRSRPFTRGRADGSAPRCSS